MEITQIKCPRCRRPSSWEDNPSRPFCSEKCRLVDLGRWSNEEYSIAGRQVVDQQRDEDQF